MLKDHVTVAWRTATRLQMHMRAEPNYVSYSKTLALTALVDRGTFLAERRPPDPLCPAPG